MKTFRCQQGVAAVEFAIVLPLLIVLAFGIIEFSLLLYNQQVITNASREGARAGIVSQNPRVTVAAIQAVVLNYCSTYLITFGNKATALHTPVITGYSASAAFAAPLTVSVTYDYKFLVIPSFSAVTSPLSLTATTVMRYE